MAAYSRVLRPPPPPSPHSTTSLPKASHLSVRTTKPKLELEETLLSLESHHAFKEASSEDLIVVYNTLISLCITNKALDEANRLWFHLQRTDHKPDIFLTNQFINLYSKCGKTNTAREIFNDMQERNLVTWNAMIAGYCSCSRFLDSLGLFQSMIESGFIPDHVTYLSALRAAAGSQHFPHGEQIHACVVKSGCLRRVQVGNALINMYAKFGRPEDAEIVGETMVEQDEVTWNSLVAANARNDRQDRALALLVEMMQVGLVPNEFTIGSLLGTEDVRVIKELHSQAFKRGLVSNVVNGSALLDAYARCQRPRDALLVFSSMPERNTVTWNSAIAASFQNDMVNVGMQLFLQMGELGFLPDEYTIVPLLKAAATHLSSGTGTQLHGLAVKMGQQTNTTTGNSLIVMYARNGSVSDAWKTFKSIADPDLISWNSMAQAHLMNEEYKQALTLFKDMKTSGFRPDEYSFATALSTCASLAQQGLGRQVHCDLIKSGLLPDSFVGSALIDMYSKAMAITEARKVFDAIESKDLITWNSIMAGLAQIGNLNQVLTLLCLMKEQEDLEPDNFTFASVLSACAKDTAISQGRQVHAVILKSSNLHIDAAVTNAIITMYSRAGSIKEAETIFSQITCKNVVSWTSMISGYAQSGYSTEALRVFNEMAISGVMPNSKTFVALLTACSYGGMSEEAFKYFKTMETKYGIKPEYDHYACMVDILGRAGKLDEAENFIEEMPYEADVLVWKMLLSGCRIHGDQDRGKRSMEKILALEPRDSAAYVLLSNLYTDLGDCNGALEVRQLMRENGVKKEPGKSWIQVRDKVHEFMAGDGSHPRRDEIYSNLKFLLIHMKDEG